MSYVKTHLVARRNARGGRSATEHLVAALRCLYKHAEDDRFITPGEHARPAGRHHEEPAQAHPVPARPHRRIPGTDRTQHRTRTTGDPDPGLSTSVAVIGGHWPSLHLDTTITLPVGVTERRLCADRPAWLARENSTSARTRRFAKWSAIFSFVILSFRVSRGCDLRRLAEDTVLGETCEALSCLFQRG